MGGREGVEGSTGGGGGGGGGSVCVCGGQVGGILWLLKMLHNSDAVALQIAASQFDRWCVCVL